MLLHTDIELFSRASGWFILDLVIGCLALIALRPLIAMLSGVSFSTELAKRDNPAFGVTVAAIILALGIILTGLLSGVPTHSFGFETFLLFLYGISGLGLLFLSRWIFDWISLPNIHVPTEIRQHNIAVALVDAGNLISASLIVKSLLWWTDSQSAYGIWLLVLMFVILQGALALIHFIRRLLRSWDLETILHKRNLARGWSEAGLHIAYTLAICSASVHLPSQSMDTVTVMLLWLVIGFSIVLTSLLLFLLLKKLILWNVHFLNEINDQYNIALGIMEAALAIISVQIVQLGYSHLINAIAVL
jgi:hypothetical protein